MYLPELLSLGFGKNIRYVERNRVCSLETFKKAFFHKIEEIGFGGNLISEMTPLLKMKNKKMTAFGLEQQTHYQVVGNDISWIFKLETF